jgi:hypothetical protein
LYALGDGANEGEGEGDTSRKRVEQDGKGVVGDREGIALGKGGTNPRKREEIVDVDGGKVVLPASCTGIATPCTTARPPCFNLQYRAAYLQDDNKSREK